jgi:hypothetical protein
MGMNFLIHLVSYEIHFPAFGRGIRFDRVRRIG